MYLAATLLYHSGEGADYAAEATTVNVHLTAERDSIIEEELQSGHLRTAQDVIAHALLALCEKDGSSLQERPSGEEAVRRMLNFAEKNRVVLKDMSVEALIHEDHKL